MSKARRNHDGAIVPFHYLLQTSLVAGTSAFVVGPNGTVSPRLNSEADAWAHYRIRDFRFRLHPDPTAVDVNSVAAGFVGGIQDTAPATIAAISELLPSVFLSGGTTVPTEWVRVSAEELRGPLPWYKSVPGNADLTEENPGQICVAGTGTQPYAIEMRGVFEFKTAVATANSPEELMLKEKLRQLAADRVRARERGKFVAMASDSGLRVALAPTSTRK